MGGNQPPAPHGPLKRPVGGPHRTRQEAPGHHQGARAPRQLRLGWWRWQDALHDRAYGAVSHSAQGSGHSPV